MSKLMWRVGLHLPAVLMVAVAVGACVTGEPAASPARRPITGGAVDETHTAVVAILGPIDGSSPLSYCTGVLIAPRAVLTAAICLKEVDVQLDQLSVSFGTTVGAGETIAVTDYVVHPDYAMQADGRPTADVAVLTLASDAPVAPMAWQRVPLGDVTGFGLTFVGYGVNDYWVGTGSGTRRQKDLPVTSVTDEFIVAGDGTGGTCFGDAGAPAIMNLGPEPVVVAINSYGEQECALWNGSTRLDIYADFIAANAPFPCTAAIISPADGMTVPGDFTVSAAVDSAAGLAQVEFALDGTVVGTLTREPWEVALSAVPDGDHEITVTATALDGVTASDTVAVTVAGDNTSTSSGGCRASGAAPPGGGVALVALALLAGLGRRRRGCSPKP